METSTRKCKNDKGKAEVAASSTTNYQPIININNPNEQRYFPLNYECLIIEGKSLTANGTSENDLCSSGSDPSSPGSITKRQIVSKQSVKGRTLLIDPRTGASLTKMKRVPPLFMKNRTQPSQHLPHARIKAKSDVRETQKEHLTKRSERERAAERKNRWTNEKKDVALPEQPGSQTANKAILPMIHDMCLLVINEKGQNQRKGCEHPTSISPTPSRPDLNQSWPTA